MGIGYSIKRLNDLLQAFSIQKRLRKLNLQTPEQVRAYQLQRLCALVSYAKDNSPFYRELYAGIDSESFALDDLPVISKQAMMSNFDRFVTNPCLKLADLQAHIDQLVTDEYFKGEFRVTSTSGSSGFKGVFLSSRKEWSWAMAAFLRCGRYVGLKPRLPNRRRVTTIAADNPIHVTYRMSISSDVGLMNAQRLDATLGIERLVAALNEFKPEFLSGYPSLLALLACEQSAGRLAISPEVVWTFGEVCTEEMVRNIKAAWGRQPFNIYGLTESGTSLGCSCSCNRGVHIFEDLFIVEVVDDQNRPVPAGTPGAKILLTNLFNFSQPLIRYEVSDILTISPEKCPCGSPFRLISSIDGRSDDILFLESGDGQPVAIHPIHFYTAMGLVKEVKQFQVLQKAGGLQIRLVVINGAGTDVVRKVTEYLRSSLEERGVYPPEISVLVVDQIDRDPQQMGKVKMIISSGREQG